MKLDSIGIVYAALLLAPIGALGGVGSSGGGMSVICRDAKGHIETAALLDLYEAELEGIPLRKPLGNLDREYALFTAELRRIVDDPRPVGPEVIKHFHENLEHFYFTPPGVKLKLIKDTGELPSIPEGCKFEQAAIYNDKNDRIDVDGEIWEAFDSLHQAALVVHEIFWFGYRRAGDPTSKSARRLTAFLFSTEPLERQKAGVPVGAPNCATFPKTHKPSAMANSQFYFYEDPEKMGTTILQFIQLLGRYTYSVVRVRVNYELDRKNLVLGVSNGRGVLKVADPYANVNAVYPVESEIFKGYQVAVRYAFNQIFSLALIDEKGTLLDQSNVGSCF